MKNLLSSAALVLTVCASQPAWAEDVTLVAPGGMRCPIDRMTPDFNRKTGHVLKATIGSGGATHQQVVRGAAFDVPIVQPLYQDVIASGNVIPATETPLASVAISKRAVLTDLHVVRRARIGRTPHGRAAGRRLVQDLIPYRQ
jgi:ABC-type molybdate transport system substrate-binding protein